MIICALLTAPTLFAKYADKAVPVTTMDDVLSAEMDPLLDTILENAKHEVKEEVEDDVSGGSASARGPDERSEELSSEVSMMQLVCFLEQ